ncbi:MAG: NAD(P)-binding oxidoreductase [Pseudomonadota bacterium]
MTQPILIMGATSGIGKLAVEEAASRNLPVRAFARGAAKIEGMDGLEPFVGDALKPEDVAGALKDVRAVIYALGIKERLAMLWEEETLFSNSTKILLDEMPNAGIDRLVVVTGFGAGRSRSAMSSLEKIGHKAILGKPYADKDRQEKMIIDSDLRWTIARPVILTNGPRVESYKVLRNPEAWRNGLISRASVAKYLIDAVEEDLDVQGDVVLTR